MPFSVNAWLMKEFEIIRAYIPRLKLFAAEAMMEQSMNP